MTADPHAPHPSTPHGEGERALARLAAASDDAWSELYDASKLIAEIIEQHEVPETYFAKVRRFDLAIGRASRARQELAAVRACARLSSTRQPKEREG